jgi:hypothetical protein
VDLMLHERSRLQQRAVDLLTGDDDTITKHSEILTPVLVSPLEHDFIDFSTEIKVPDLDINSVNTQQIDSHENSDSVWNPFPRIADFTSSVKSVAADDFFREALNPQSYYFSLVIAAYHFHLRMSLTHLYYSCSLDYKLGHRGLHCLIHY